MCEYCRLERVGYEVRGSFLPNIAQFIPGKERYFIDYDIFVEDFFLKEQKKKRTRIIWPISHCPNCGERLLAKNIINLYGGNQHGNEILC